MAVLSKLQLLNSTLTYKNWSPAFAGIFGCITIAKIYSSSFR
ncbi:Protein CBG11177 [Caenorhabditis briggsae]|uniref:Protein CBG11177 n=2 Tax=Caenorhabditis TaxID=6237 RepID=A8XCM3_CAEBR|nr:Protein CBG11177 [Caenorhabditis briggsae]CAP30372.1 Protein CBG11177 [Caenorhabditis briggsae]